MNDRTNNEDTKMNANGIEDKALLEEARLTAFALGELEGAEKDAMARRVEEDADARNFVKATNATAQRLESELKKELKDTPAVKSALSPGGKGKSDSGTPPARREMQAASPRKSKRYWLFGIGTAAAALLLACVSLPLFSAKREGARQSALGPPCPLKCDTKSADTALGRNEYKYSVHPEVPSATTAPMAPSRLQASTTILPGIPVQPPPQIPPPLVNPDQGQNNGTNDFKHIVDNNFLRVSDHPLSTFSIDVDTGSYAIVRSFLMQRGQLPPPDAVRIEEMINYFNYDYEGPTDDTPFATHVEVAPCPWRPEHRLAKIGLKGHEIIPDSRPLSNLVFLLDVSGSMRSSNKLPYVQKAMSMLVNQLNEGDYVSIVVYAGASGVVLSPTSGDRKKVIIDSLNRLQAGGSTNGGQGIRLAYNLARQHFVQGGCNRVILCTDGDFNVGTTSRGDLIRLIEKEAKSGVFLSVFGFGMGNLKDGTLEQLADKGNGNYGYIDTLNEARKLFVEQMSGTLVTIAKDVKIQVEFNPTVVAGYRLIGYENRLLRKEDFNDDTKDAGEIGAGHTVTALYEIVPAGKPVPTPPGVDPLKYQTTPQPTEAAESGEMMTLKLRYKEPDGDTSKLLTFPIIDKGLTQGKSTPDFRFAAAVASFGMLLRDSPYKGVSTPEFVLELAGEGLGDDLNGYRAEFIKLVRRAGSLVEQRDAQVRTHVIQPGDTLSAIAQRYLGSGGPRAVKRLTDENPGIDPLKLQVGHKLRIPTP